MKSVLEMIKMILVMGILAGIPFLLSCAQPQPGQPPGGVVVQVHKSDLSVEAIHSKCVCPETKKVNAILLISRAIW